MALDHPVKELLLKFHQTDISYLSATLIADHGR